MDLMPTLDENDNKSVSTDSTANLGPTTKPVTILDWRNDSGLSDILHQKSDISSSGCTYKRCTGSKMNQACAKTISEDKALMQAKDFLHQYYSDNINHEKPKLSYEAREKEVLQQLRTRQTYKLTHDELVWGARMAWRNAPRCPARVIWKNLTVFDKRHIDDAEGMFIAIKEHLAFSNNGGNIRPAITIFRQRRPGKKDPRVWNNLMCQFAGYEQVDGSVVGDPSAVGITKFCEKLGWKGKGTPYDFLPLLLSGADGEPHYFEVPENLCLRVRIEHPTNEGITNMGLQWFGLPGVSSMMFECGGLQFPGAPFAGWYQGTEVASRDLLDPQRYNLLYPLGEAMDLDMSSNTTLWKDEVALELNKAVLYSYKKAGISMVDHFTQADQFIEHMKEETKVRGGCPADWVWIVPPQSGSLVSTFHQEMLNYHLSPSYEYQDKPYETWYRSEKPRTFYMVAKAVYVWMRLYLKMVGMRKNCTVYYSSETGTAKKFAKTTAELFHLSFKTKLVPLDRHPLQLIETVKEAEIEILIASTFGNGEAPEMSREYEKALSDQVEAYKMNNGNYNTADDETNKKYFAVFGLGSTAYPKFANFGKFLHGSYETLGGTPILPFTTGDELKDQQGSFNKWLKKVFMTSLKIMDIEPPRSYKEHSNVVKPFKWKLANKNKIKSRKNALSEFHDQNVVEYTMAKRTNLISDPKEPATLKIELNLLEKSGKSYEVGDHLCILPQNLKENVDYLKSRLNNNPPSDRLVTLQCETGGLWEDVEDFPVGVNYDDLLTNFLDIMKPPSQSLLQLFSQYAESKHEHEELVKLANDDVVYEKWKSGGKDIIETLQEFVSVNISSATLAGQIGIIQPRKYSIASSPENLMDNSDLCLIAGVHRFQSESGRVKIGLTTGMLESVKLETKIYGYLQTSHFKLPNDPTWPVVMICAGSGIAPFRGFWMKRFQQCQEGQIVGPTLLYFGCRKKTSNLVKNELDVASNSYPGILKRMICRSDIMNEYQFTKYVAYSREQNQPKQYVQNLLVRDATRIFDLWIKQGGYIYVCGKIQMATEVEKTLKNIMKHMGIMTDEQTELTMDSMRKNMRYQEDVFG